MIIKQSIKLSLFLLFILVLQTVNAQSGTAVFPRLEPDPKAVEYYNLGLRSGYSWQDLGEIALWASGDTDLSYLQRIHDTVTDLNNSAGMPSSMRERSEFILEYMHSNLLQTYSVYQTRLDTVFTNGRFNCVSSSVLYMILCKSAGIETSGVMTRDHVFIVVHINEGNSETSIDVETTNRFGFDPGSRKEFHDQLGRVTGFTYVPARNHRDRQTISQIELVSLILNNRIAEAERLNRFPEAVPLAIDKAALLLGNIQGESEPLPENRLSGTFFENPRKNVMDRLINYGGTLLRANREEDALLWAARASEMYPNEDRWHDFFKAAVNNRAARLLRDRRITEARNVLESNRMFLSREDYEQLKNIVNTAAAADYHNRFAAAWNRQNRDEALRILNEGLAEFPNDRQLLANRDIVNREF